MLAGYFTERPYRGLSEEEILQHGSYFSMPNSKFDPAIASRDYNYYLDENCYAEELGFDAVALNEHHGNPFCMGSTMNLEAAILARITERVRLLLIGNPLPAHRNPLRMAEELAEIDLISRGRLIAGWVRGSGPEQFFNNTNPAHNREMFEEALAFVEQAWTRPGPWRYEGNHFHYRHVNPWVLPYQKPRPPTVIPGVLSLETIEWAAEHAYPYLGLGTSLGPTAELWNSYADRAAECGYQAGSENFAYLTMASVAATEEEAIEVARYHLYANGNGSFARPEYTLPAGFNSPAAIKRLAKMPSSGWLGVSREKLNGSDTGRGEFDMAKAKSRIDESFHRHVRNMQIVAGTPDQVIPKIKQMVSVLRPGLMVFMNVQGNCSNERRRENMRLIANEVLPEIRAHSKALGLQSMLDVEPGSRRLEPGQQRQPVVDLSALETLVD
ncbi:MAG TPA: LLM class flavin-dependent oxidoreductase [Ilumatobacteraceae bacterium]|nr:LLM class flavin-dependent oxidoreductase [Ilumatobacteraceae bacterium]